MRWVLSLWTSKDLALAIDPTTLSDRLCIDGGMRMPARRPVSAPGNSFIGSGTAFRAKSKRLRGTIIVIWAEGQDEPWIILTDLEPLEAGASWRQMRFWIETGFKALKSVDWQWRKTRRTDPARVERHWLVLSAAPPLTLATDSRAEDAKALKRDPSALRAPPKAAPERNRLVSVFRLGLSTLIRLLSKGRMWRRARLLPEPWPPPPEGVKVVCHPEIRNLPLQAHKVRGDPLAAICT